MNPHWTVGDQIAVNCNTTDVPAYHEIREDGRVVARGLIASHDGPKALERAHLVAAAPNLLEILKEAMCCEGSFPLPDWYMKAQAIIARAGGR
mgnify:CR=1 FL=1